MTKRIFPAIAVAVFFFAACNNGEQKPADDNSAKMKEAIKVVFSAFETGNTDGLDAVIDSNFVEHCPPPNFEVKGLDGFKQLVKVNHEAFPDAKLTIHNIAVDGDVAMVHYNWKGTNSGSMGPDYPATNKPIDVNGVDIIKFAKGKGAEHWGYFEEQKMMTQLGITNMGAPAEASTPKEDEKK